MSKNPLGAWLDHAKPHKATVRGAKMKLIDLAGYLGLLLAIGAAFDFALRPATKMKVVRLLRHVARSRTPNHFTGSSILSRLFGVKIFSRRAISLYIVISLLSVGASVAIAFLTTPYELQGYLNIFPTGVSQAALVILGICLFGCIIGDIISYAQTRVFIRTVDTYKNPVISIGLSLADIVISLALMFLIFSLSRFICYLIVLDEGVPPLVTTRYVIQELLTPQLPRIANLDRGASARPQFQMATLVARATSSEDLSRLETRLREIELNSLSDPRPYQGLRYRISRRCLSAAPTGAYRELMQTFQLVNALVPEQVENRTQVINGISHSMGDDLRLRTRRNENCPVHILIIRKSLDARDLVGAAGLTNSYVASLERTLYDGYRTVAFKFSNYIYFDPREGVHQYLGSVNTMARTTFLGAFPNDPDATSVLSDFETLTVVERSLVRVPFSPIISSSLTTSIFFFIYLLFVFTAQLRILLATAVGKLLPGFAINKAVFTSIGVVLTCVVLGLHVISSLLGWLWMTLLA